MVFNASLMASLAGGSCLGFFLGLAAFTGGGSSCNFSSCSAGRSSFLAASLNVLTSGAEINFVGWGLLLVMHRQCQSACSFAHLRGVCKIASGFPLPSKHCNLLWYVRSQP